MSPATLHADDPVTLGRRERKKLETRDALARAALDLFERRGLDGTTVEDITDVVDVSPRTFHRYFGAKEDVLFADSADRCARFAHALAARPEDEPLLTSLRIVVADLTGRFVANEDFERRRLRMVRGNPALAMRNLQQAQQWSQAVEVHAASRLGMQMSDPLPVLLGACTVAALRTALDRWLVSPDVDYRVEVERSFDVLADLRAATTPRRAGTRA